MSNATAVADSPLSLGLLPGVLRAELIDKGRAVESHLRLADLAGGFFIGNLRGLVPQAGWWMLPIASMTVALSLSKGAAFRGAFDRLRATVYRAVANLSHAALAKSGRRL